MLHIVFVVLQLLLPFLVRIFTDLYPRLETNTGIQRLPFPVSRSTFVSFRAKAVICIRLLKGYGCQKIRAGAIKPDMKEGALQLSP